MKDRSDLLFLVFLNAVIMLAAETVGDGRFFFDTGSAQAFAVLFVVLAMTRIVAVSRLHDPTLKKMIQGCFLAMLVFAEAHLLALMDKLYLYMTVDTLLVSMVNLSLAGLLLLIIGTQFVLKIRSQEKSSLIIGAAAFMLLFLSALSVFFVANDGIVSLAPDEPVAAIYGLIVLAVGAFSVISMDKARKAMSVLDRYWRYMIGGAVLVSASALITAHQGFLVRQAGIPPHQAAYLSVFAFSIGASLMFLAFGATRKMSGIYADLEAEAKLDT